MDNIPFLPNNTYTLPSQDPTFSVDLICRMHMRQIKSDQERPEYLTISTHKGLYSHTKLPYGIKSAPKIFQTKIKMIWLEVEKCFCKQDDIPIGGVSWQEYFKILAEILERLHKYNIHLKLPKCEFLKTELIY